MMERREFLKNAVAAGALAAGTQLSGCFAPPSPYPVATGGGIDIEEGVAMLESGKAKNTPPEIRPEIINNPRAVFLMETHVSGEPDENGFYTALEPQLFEAGKTVAETIFIKGTGKGGSTFVKTNYTWIPPNCYNPTCGVITSPDFTAGFVTALREMGNTNIMVGDRGGTNIRNHRMVGIYDVMDRYGIDVMMPTYRHFSHYKKRELNWHVVPDPVVWKKIPTFRPLGDPDNLFIDMAKLKSHYLTGTTLTLKNLQGAVPTGYGHYCNQWAELEYLVENVYLIDRKHFKKDWQRRVESLFLKHRAAGFKYWDYEGSYAKYEAKGGWDYYKKIRKDREALKEFMREHPYLLRDELWTQRALDSAAAIKPSLNIIEGVIGRDGDGFGVGRDEICNIVIAGLSTFECDVVGSWMMGHDTRELWFTRIAKERGLAECDPEKIEIYIMRKDGITRVRNIADLPRYRLGCNIHSMQKETGKRLFW